MEATFRPELMFELGPFDLGRAGGGRAPLLRAARENPAGEPLAGIAGTAERSRNGGVLRIPQQLARSR